MTDAVSLIERAKKYAAAQKLELTTVSKRLFADHRRIAAIEAGDSFLRPPTLKRALAKMTELEGGDGSSRTSNDDAEAASDAA